MISPADTLVLMPCGARKLAGTHELLYLYTGPLWSTLRTHMGEIPPVNVCVLSAEYGFVNARSWGETYNRRLSKEMANRAIERGIMMPNDQFGRLNPRKGTTACNAWVAANCPARDHRYTAVIQAGAGEYGRVLESYIRAMMEFRGIAPDAWVGSLNGTGRGIGEQRSALTKFLQYVNGGAKP